MGLSVVPLNRVTPVVLPEGFYNREGLYAHTEGRSTSLWLPLTLGSPLPEPGRLAAISLTSVMPRLLYVFLGFAAMLFYPSRDNVKNNEA